MADTSAPAIRLEQYFAHPPAKVWRAITDPERLARWWAKGDIAPVVGHRFELDMGQWGLVPCTVLDVEPERLLRFAFGQSWTITWRLEPEGDGTRFYLDHEGFDLSNPQDQFALENMGPGWRDIVLPRLQALLDDA